MLKFIYIVLYWVVCSSIIAAVTGHYPSPYLREVLILLAGIGAGGILFGMKESQ